MRPQQGVKRDGRKNDWMGFKICCYVKEPIQACKLLGKLLSRTSKGFSYWDALLELLRMDLKKALFQNLEGTNLWE